MNYSVQLFAHLRERHGNFVEVDADSTVKDVLEALAAGGIKTAGCRLAVNLKFSTATESIPENAELALIPPVTGG